VFFRDQDFAVAKEKTDGYWADVWHIFSEIPEQVQVWLAQSVVNDD